MPEGIVALFSCSEREKSWESPELKHGVFFYYFLEGWRGGGARRQADAGRRHLVHGRQDAGLRPRQTQGDAAAAAEK